MTLPKEKREQAFALYCLGLSQQHICDELQIKSKTTVFRWIKKFSWDEKKQYLTQIAMVKGLKGTVERNKRILDSILGLFAKATVERQDDLVTKITPRDAMEAIKVRQLVEGFPTEIVAVPTDKIMDDMDEAYERHRKIFEAKERNASSNDGDE